MDLICIAPPFNTNRNCEVFWDESKENPCRADRIRSATALPIVVFSNAEALVYK